MPVAAGSRNRLIVAVLLILFGTGWHWGLLDPVRDGLYDAGQQLSGPLQKHGVVLLAIDRESLRRLNTYPIRQADRAGIVNRLFAMGAYQVAWLDIPDMSRGTRGSALVRSPAGRLISGMPVMLGTGGGGQGELLPAYVRQFAIDSKQLHDVRPVPAYPVLPWPVSAGNTASVFAPYPVAAQDKDSVRGVPLMLDHDGMLLPSVALQMLISSSEQADAGPMRGGRLRVGSRVLWTDDRLVAYPHIDPSSIGRDAAIEEIPLYELLQGKVPHDRLQGSHVLVGVTAPGLVPGIAVPGGSLSPVQLSAVTLASMLDGRLMAIPAWTLWVIAGFALAAGLLLLWLPALGKARGIMLIAVMLTSMLGAQFWGMMFMHLWLDVSLPVVLLLAGSLIMFRFGARKKAEDYSDIGATEIHRRVGLASQKRGELDAAYESFRKCPLDDSIMVLLYYLAQDFEEAEDYDRAGSVYRYMRSYDPGFKDIAERAENARMLQDTVMMDAAGVMPDENAEEEYDDTPDGSILGRYRIERRIGKGAMGMVYLGADPKINRTVAIKTLNLKREFDADEQENVLQRFFREAEAAGRLHHPHIVTIYDAGEANDMAYIAMEYLTGTDLRFYTREDSLLPPLSVVKIGMKLADALAYAHSNNIIHRDIKAANVMYDPQSGQLKITDFGIARLTDSRRTKTGMVLGTPSSMSPEQLRGKELDGRTDLYSLGVLLYQLLSGQLPYKADSLTQLMVKITSGDPADLVSLRPELKERGQCIVEIVDKLLQKDVDNRYQDGKKLSRDLLACAKSMAAGK